jgi:hypothetical protein
MNASADTIEEFQKSYADSYFGLRIKDKVFPAKIKAVSRNVLTCTYTAAKSGGTLSHEIDWLTGRDILDRDYPDLGCVKIGPTVGYMSVRPYRQFKKGYVPDNAEIMVPNKQQIRKVLPRFVPSTSHKDVVWAVYNPEYWHPDEARRLFSVGEGVGYPLSINFSLYLNSDVPNPLIGYKTRSIGVYNESKRRYELFKGMEIFKEQFERETKVKIHNG